MVDRVIIRFSHNDSIDGLPFGAFEDKGEEARLVGKVRDALR